MKLLTIQNVEVYRQLNRKQVYRASIDNIKLDENGYSNLTKPYQMMMEQYGYSNIPIFCSVLGRKCEFYGARTKNALLLELDVPDTEIKLQSYYDWVDVIYFTELPEDWEGNDLEQFIKDTLNGLNTDNQNTAIQATIPEIRPEWLKGYYKLTDKFFSLHYGSGGSSILTESSYKPIVTQAS